MMLLRTSIRRFFSLMDEKQFLKVAGAEMEALT